MEKTRSAGHKTITVSDDEKSRSPRNKTLSISENEKLALSQQILQPDFSATSLPLNIQDIRDKIICSDFFSAAPFLPKNTYNLLIADPPYNLTKNYHGKVFKKTDDEEYTAFTEQWLQKCLPLLTKDASVYICGDWHTAALMYPVISKYLTVRSRITWQREKGRGAKQNWKNGLEDIWFATVTDSYYFNVDDVKQKRRVIAPYRADGQPKDWEETEDGKFRLTYPSNFWDDISIPYWSMSENTEHPTQKSEKLYAKIILASSYPNAHILDPFGGSGTTAAVCTKLGRSFTMIEQNFEYCLWAQKRILAALEDPSIQGYTDGVFWERNTSQEQKQNAAGRNRQQQPTLL